MEGKAEDGRRNASADSRQTAARVVAVRSSAALLLLLLLPLLGVDRGIVDVAAGAVSDDEAAGQAVAS